MKILIVDDESLAISRLTRLLNDLGYGDITSFDNPMEAIKDVTKNSYDVAFLDISMPSMTGLELADTIISLKSNIFIVFQTAYSEYALEAYKAGGLAYLLKPVDTDELQKVMVKVSEFSNTSAVDNKKIVGKRGDKLYLIDIDDIYYIKADLDEVIIKIKETDVYVRRKIGDLETLLSGKNFFRIHRSYIVNVDKIRSMKSVEQSKLQISFDGISDIVTSSKDGAKEFREYIEKRSL